MTVSITTTSVTAQLKSPFNPNLAAAAKKIGGTWRGGVWVFDLRDIERVRALAIDVYGTDGTPTALATVRIGHGLFGQHQSELWLFGRKIAERRGRDSDVRLGDDVIIIDGSFPGRGGSARFPSISPNDDIVLEIRNVPADHKDMTEYAQWITVIDRTEPVDTRTEYDLLTARLADLDAERQQITARLADLDAS